MPASATRLLLITLAFLSLLMLTAADDPPRDDGSLNLDNKSNGHSADVGVGKKIIVVLQEDTSNPDYTISYTAPISSDEATVAPDKAIVAPDVGAEGHFRAAAEGTADITAKGVCKETDEAADPKKCPESVDYWKVTVTVAAGGTEPPTDP